jgi:hypothetical protein
MINCTSKEVFVAALDNIEEGKGEVIVSVLENLLCDAVKTLTDPEAINTALEGAIKKYLTTIAEAADKRPNVKFALAQPILRPAHNWFMEGYEVFCRKLREGIRMMDKRNVGKIDVSIRMSQVFESDGIHLTESAGKVFVNTLLFNADALFNAEVVDLEEEMECGGSQEEKEDSRREDGGGKNTSQFTKKIMLVESEIAKLKEDIVRRRENDCLVTARIREELDFFSNTKKEDRIVVTGLTSQVPMPVAFKEKKK